MGQFDQYKSLSDKADSMYTVVTNGVTGQELVDDFYQRLAKIKKMGDGVKRKYLNDRMYSIIQYLEARKEETLNCVLLVGKEIHEIPLSKRQRGILTEFRVPTLVIRNDRQFDVSYLEDLLNNTDYYDVIQVKNNILKHFQITKTKRRLVTTIEKKGMNIEEYLPVSKQIIIHGVSSALKNLKTAHPVFKKHLTDHEILDYFKTRTMKKLHDRLVQEMFIPFQRADDKILIGKDLVFAINEMRVKTVFCTKKKFKKLKETFSPDLLNFEMVIVKSMDTGDPADQLKRDFMGVIGIAYY